MRTLPSAETSRHLARLVRKLRKDRAFMASVLTEYQRQESLSETALANLLSIDPGQMNRLALCKRPVSQDAVFAEQVRQIASYVGADHATLAQIIRQVEALEHFLSLAAANDSEPNERRVPSTSGLMAAARDREEPETKPDDKTVDSGDPKR